ncbi:unnamed protein product [Linum tenue]|uniref:Uncharacterized protein n=1 Tax=Linum tenue TaxID=586396 RepID=A0AAV0P9S1_9ROSI|nr:unnamed protein product [Linum tenue]
MCRLARSFPLPPPENGAGSVLLYRTTCSANWQTISSSRF